MKTAAPGCVVFFVVDSSPVARVTLLPKDDDSHAHCAVVHGNKVNLNEQRAVSVSRILVVKNVPLVYTDPSKEEVLAKRPEVYRIAR